MNVEIINVNSRKNRGAIEYVVFVDEYENTPEYNKRIINTVEPWNFGGTVTRVHSNNNKIKLNVKVYTD